METSRSKIKKKPSRKEHLDITSSLNKYFICNDCGQQYENKVKLINHIPLCVFERDRYNVTCKWCKQEFKNRGSLVTHAIHIHGDFSYKTPSTSTVKFSCDVCNRSFSNHRQRTYHIRKQHFNLTVRAPYCEFKKVNQVWFENVLNSNNVVEMKKISENTLVMRKLDSNTAIKVHETYRKLIDLRKIYPTGRSTEQVLCNICYKSFTKKDFKKHMDETHYNITKHRCNSCNTNFKRTYTFMKHVCRKARKVKGIRNCHKDLRISSVETLPVA